MSSCSPRSQRAPAVAVEVSVPAFGIWFAAIAATVSRDGIFLSTFHEVPAGTRVEVDIAMREGDPVKVAGVAVEHPLEGIGIDIAWSDLEPDARARIEAIVPRVPAAPESGVRPRIA